MAELSQKAKVVSLAAYERTRPSAGPFTLDSIVAASFRAAARELRKAYANEEHVDHPDDWLDNLAAELEGDDPTDTNED